MVIRGRWYLFMNNKEVFEGSNVNDTIYDICYYLLFYWYYLKSIFLKAR